MTAEKLPYVVDENVEKASKLSAQWPKIHACSGRQFFGRILSYEDLADFRLRTAFHASDRDAFCAMEHRQCECNSTLVVLTDIFDLESE